MSYTLVYSHGGHEMTFAELPTIADVNYQIRKLYDNSDKPITILRIQEDHDGPRTWQIEYPPAPPAGTRVRTAKGTGPFEMGEDGRIAGRLWRAFVEEYGPLTEVVETEVEAAARRLRDRKDVLGSFAPADRDADTVLDHVLNGGQLPEAAK